MEYTRIIKRAWQITWRHKALWLFGFLLALFGAGGGSSSGRGLQYTIGPESGMRPQWIVGILLFMAVVVFLAVVLVIVLTNISKAALVGMVDEADQSGETSVRSGWRIGRSRLWRLFGIDLALGIPMFFAAILLIAIGLSPLLLLAARSGALAAREALTAVSILLTVLLTLVAIAVLTVVGVVVGFVRDMAYRQAVLGQMGVMDSIRSGYRLARANLRHVGVMWLLLFGIDLVVGIVFVPLFLLVGGIAVAPAAAVYGATEQALPAILTGAVIGIPMVLLLSVLGGVYQVFRSAAWTLTYRELPAVSEAV